MHGKSHRPPEYNDVWADSAPQVREIAHKFELAGLAEWNNARVTALARALGKTIYTLCADAGLFYSVYDQERDIFKLVLDRKKIADYWRASYWPVYVTAQWDRLEQYLKLRNGESVPMLSTADVLIAKDLANRPN